MSEYIVDFGDDAKSAVRIAMAKQHGAKILGEVVRCVDCKYSIAFGNGCMWWGDGVDTETDGSCTYGERRVINDGD